MSDANQPVFDFHLLASSQQKSSTVSVVFDLGKDGLWFSHSPTPQFDAQRGVEPLARSSLEAEQVVADRDTAIIV